MNIHRDLQTLRKMQPGTFGGQSRVATPVSPTNLQQPRIVPLPSEETPGGIGWRPGVPHIVIHAGDTPPCCPFPVGWVPVEYITPSSPLGLPVPVACLREDNRIGTVGDPLVSPPNAATMPATIEALDDLNIAVVTITNNSSPVWESGQNEPSYAQLIDMYETGEFSDFSEFDDWGGTHNVHAWGAAMAALTGAISDFPNPQGHTPSLMSYSMFDEVPRWTNPTSSNAEEFVDFLLPRILGLAESLGSDTQFDIACCIDQSGSFSGPSTIATQVFQTIIERCRDDTRDIFVGVSTFEDYGGPYTYAEAFDRPFILHHPIASVQSDEEFDAMITALNNEPLGDGGDTPETQYEALYQIATGVGFSGPNDGIKTRSGPSGEPGDGTDGSGYMTPGTSGDVPAFDAGSA